MLFLQAHRNPFFDLAALILHVVGYGLMYAVVVVLAFRYVRPALGVRLCVVWAVMGAAVEGIKRLVAAPRPYMMYPDVLFPLFPQEGFSFPSGHVAGAVVMWGCLALRSRQRAHWVMVGVYVLLMAWSRMYLGVHFLHDVAGGILLGGLLLWGIDIVGFMRF